MSHPTTADATPGAAPVAAGAMGLGEKARQLWERPLVAWTTILLLQAGIVWRIWEWRDLPFGDTSSYFAEAAQWNRTGRFEVADLVFSPLYVAFLGLFQRAFSDAYAAITAHKLVILMASSSVALGVLRAILPKSWAWLIAAWWVLVPTNPFLLHHYDVHVFGFVILALGCWLAGVREGPVWRGCGLACLAAGALFVRNEFLPAVGLFAAAWIGDALWRVRKGREFFANAVALCAPTLLVCGALGMWLAHGIDEPGLRARLGEEFDLRHRANLVQVYPYGYQQRHADWAKDPWHDGPELLLRDFGQPAVSFREALRANPQAIAEHVVWNFSLLPAGLQLGLFGRHAGATSPDFLGTTGDRPVATWLLGGVLAICVGGIFCAWSRPRPRLCAAPGGWTWLALLCCVPSLLVAIATQRPRPSYILLLLLLLMAVTGLALWLIEAKFPAVRRLNLPVLAGIAVLIAAFPLFAQRRPAGPAPRNLLEVYRALQPCQWALRDGFDDFYTNEPVAVELAHYFGWTGAHGPLRALQAAVDGAPDFAEAIGKSGARRVFLTGDALDRAGIAAWRERSRALGWQLIGSSRGSGVRWELHARETSVP